MQDLRLKKNGGKWHVFLGHPASNGLDKTVVEPGNAFSPGLWTLGVSLAVRANGALIAPQTSELPLCFEENRPPITVSEYDAAGVSVRSRLTHLGGKGWQGVDFFEAEVGDGAQDAALVVTDIGPAGGKIDAMTWNDETETLSVSNGTSFVFETPVEPEIYPADAQFDSPCAIVHFRRTLRVRVLHGYQGRAFNNYEPYDTERLHMSVVQGFEAARMEWEAALPARVYAPDPRIARVWEQTAYHMIGAMECDLPRISVNNYPIFWIRDCVIVLRALDLMGRDDLVREGCDYLAPLIFSGGFGAESDNPGEGLWLLSEHALLGGEWEWARSILPHLAERVKWIRCMAEAEEPIYRPADMRTIWGHFCPGSDLVCLRHKGNHIHGRMDGHSPDYYINVWAVAGLRSACRLLEKIGETEKLVEWCALKRRLENAVRDELFDTYGNERDLCVSPYPAGVVGNIDRLKEEFVRVYDRIRRNEDGSRKREELWTYFEAAQIHNAILLGERERAWINLDGMLDEGFGMAVYTEGRCGDKEMLPFGTGHYGRGWLQEGAAAANMPHNWTSGEMALLLRSLFLVEEETGLRLLSGVPKEWLKPGKVFGARNMPTSFGKVSFDVQVTASGEVEVHFSQGGDIPHWIDLPKGAKEATS